MTPIRIQLSRAKGFNLQAASVAVNGLPAVSVARPSVWGNPFKYTGSIARYRTAQRAVDMFKEVALEDMVKHGRHFGYFKLETLRGKNLACWCKLGQPCHADVLLELANALPKEEE